MTTEPTPPCRVCGKNNDIVSYPDDQSRAICPGCCEKSEHHDGETGHGWDYERGERDHSCRYCGILRRNTNYRESD